MSCFLNYSGFEFIFTTVYAIAVSSDRYQDLFHLQRQEHRDIR